MKKAPSRYKKALGGEINDPKKKKPIVSSTPTAARAMALSGIINKSTADAYESEAHSLTMPDDNTKRFSPSIEKAGEAPDSGRSYIGGDANGNKTYRDTKTGETYTLDKDGKKYAKGGTVKKMTKAPL